MPGTIFEAVVMPNVALSCYILRGESRGFGFVPNMVLSASFTIIAARDWSLP